MRRSEGDEETYCGQQRLVDFGIRIVLRGGSKIERKEKKKKFGERGEETRGRENIQ